MITERTIRRSLVEVRLAKVRALRLRDGEVGSDHGMYTAAANKMAAVETTLKWVLGESIRGQTLLQLIVRNFPDHISAFFAAYGGHKS